MKIRKLNRRDYLIGLCVLLFAALLVWCAIIAFGGDESQEQYVWKEYECKLEKEHLHLMFRGVLDSSRSIPVVARARGRITELAKQGAEVKKGDLLFSIDDTNAKEEIENQENNLDSTELSLEQFRANYELVKFREDNRVREYEERLSHALLEESEELAQPNARQLRIMELDELVAQLNVDDAQDAYDREKRMFDKGYTTISALEPYQRSLENAKAVLEELKLKNQIERKGISDERRVELRKAVERAKSNLERIGQRRKRRLEGIETQISAEEQNLEVIKYTIAHAQEQIDNASVYAPCDGVFKLLVYRDWTAGGLSREVQVGDEKRPEDVVGHIIDPSDMMVKLVVNEADFPQLKVGMPVTMTVPSFPGKVFTGKIRQLGAIGKDRNTIDPIAAGSGDSEVIMFNAAVDFDGQGTRFHPGMSADIKVKVSNYIEGLFIPRAAVIDKDGHYFVYVSTDGAQKQISGRNFNEMSFLVKSGLEKGDIIYIRQNRQK